MARRPGFIMDGRATVEPLPSPHRVIPEITVQIRVHYPANAPLEIAQKLLTQVYAQAFAEISERLS